MNAYAVCIPEYRTWYDYYQMDPPETGIPIDVFAAETRGQAKVDALREWCQARMGVYSDDFPALRTRLLARNVRVPRGQYKGDDSIWGLIPRDWPVIKERPMLVSM